MGSSSIISHFISSKFNCSFINVQLKARQRQWFYLNRTGKYCLCQLLVCNLVSLYELSLIIMSIFQTMQQQNAATSARQMAAKIDLWEMGTLLLLVKLTIQLPSSYTKSCLANAWIPRYLDTWNSLRDTVSSIMMI